MGRQPGDEQEREAAKLAFDNSGTARAGRPSVSLHPAFATIVATWFAALFGLGSLIVPTELLEHALMSLGIAALLPVANPPLGPTAIGLVALAAAIAGGLAGSAIGRRVARAHREHWLPEEHRLAPGPPRPISVREELGGDSLTKGSERQAAPPRTTAVAGGDGSNERRHIMPERQRIGDRAVGPETGASSPAPSYAQSAPSDLARLVERLGTSLERRRARAARPRPPSATRARASLATLPADCAPPRTDTDAALRAALAKLHEVNVPR
jgi:hypothetical protein